MGGTAQASVYTRRGPSGFPNTRMILKIAPGTSVPRPDAITLERRGENGVPPRRRGLSTAEHAGTLPLPVDISSTECWRPPPSRTIRREPQLLPQRFEIMQDQGDGPRVVFESHSLGGFARYPDVWLLARPGSGVH